MADANAVVRIRAVDETKAAFASVETSLRGLTRSAGLIKSAFGGIAGLVGVGGIVSLARDVTRAVIEAEQSEARLTAVLRATQNAVGLTRDELEGLIDDLAGKTLFDDEALRNSVSVLATFKNVAGDAFQRTLSLAADLSGLLGGDLQQAVLLLGKAVNDPVRGFTQLRRVVGDLQGISQEQLENLVESNQLYKAQEILLQAVEGRFGGLAQEMNTGLVGATTNATKAWNDLLEAFGKTNTVSAPVTQTLNAFALGFKAAEEAIIEFDKKARNSLLFQAGLPQGAGKLGEFTKEQAEALRAATAQLPTGRRTTIAPERQVREEDKKTKRDDFTAIIEQLNREQQAIQNLSIEQRILADIEAKRFKLTPAQDAKVRGLIAETEQRRESRRLFEEEQDAEQNLFEAQLENLQRRSDFAEDFREETERQRLASEAERKELEQTAEAYRQIADPARRYKQQLEEIAALEGVEGGLSIEEAARASDAIQKEIDKIGKKTSDIGQQLGLTFSSAIEDAIVELRDLGDVADAVFQDILRLSVRKGITEPLLGAVGGILEGSGGGGGGFIDKVLSIFGFAKGGIMTPHGPLELQSFVTGGIANKNGLAMFHRNEAIIPLPDGRSVPVSIKGDAGRSVVINMNVQTQDADSFRRSRKQILGDLQRELRLI